MLVISEDECANAHVQGAVVKVDEQASSAPRLRRSQQSSRQMLTNLRALIDHRKGGLSDEGHACPQPAPRTSLFHRFVQADQARAACEPRWHSRLSFL